jgi:hypothetical protein
MEGNLAVVVGVVALLILLALAWGLRRRRSTNLQQRFGPEYTEVVREHRDRRAAERVLEQRERRVAAFHIRALTADDAARFAESWHRTQAEFVDDPQSAVTGADRLVVEVMHARGYPMTEFEQRAADISVDHPAIADRHARGEASTEDLRQAFVHYRTLFDELLDVREEPLRRAAGGRR